MNLQNLPKSGEGKVVKACLRPKLDAFLFCDYKAVEYRVLAFYLASIGYPEMAEDFRNGLDPHRQNAIRLLNKDEVTEEERDFGKTMNFAAIYGAGPEHIGDMLWGKKPKGSPAWKAQKARATKVWLQFYEVNPGIRKLSNPKTKWYDPDYVPGALENILRSRGDVRTLWGRRLHPEFEYRALNSLIQGCSADLLRASMVKVHEFLNDWGFVSHMVMPVHDELVFDCTRDELPALAEIVPTLMKDPRIEAVVPIEVDLEVSFESWATKEDYWESELSLTSSSM